MIVQTTTWALIPIKAQGEGKSRLALTLSEKEREGLIDAMLRHVIKTLAQARTVTRTLLVGPSRHGQDPAITLLNECGFGLNAVLDSALEQITGMEGCPKRLIVIAADLPCLTPLDLDLLGAAPDRAVAIAPDRHGTGTNALSLPLPEAAGFRFHYGTDSAVRHQQEAERLGLSVETILSQGLEKDIDGPADLPDAAHMYGIEGQVNGGS